MTGQNDIRRICSKLPGAHESMGNQFGFHVLVGGRERGFVWSWLERHDPKKARVPNDRVLAVLVQSLDAKELLLRSEPDRFFTEPHYNGYPAILVHLDLVSPEELEELIIEAWRCRASKEHLAEFA